MQATAIIGPTQLKELLHRVFETGSPEVYEAYSEYDQALKRFLDVEQIETCLASRAKAGERMGLFAIYYPDARGKIEKRRFPLNPMKCQGHTFRHDLTGWGVIQLQFDFKKRPDIECRIAVNTEKRANVWSSTYPDMGAPGLWDWKAVERHAGRLIRHLRKLGRSYRASQKGSPSAGN